MTAETALVLPAVVLLLALATSVATGVVTQVRCADAARAAARAAARGDAPEQVRWAAAALAPEGARVEVSPTRGSSTGSALVRVTVVAPVWSPLPGGPSLDASGSATALVEPEGW